MLLCKLKFMEVNAMKNTYYEKFAFEAKGQNII